MQEAQFENVVSFYAAALANLKVVMGDAPAGGLGDLLRNSEARGAICSADQIPAYYNVIEGLERYPQGQSYKVIGSFERVLRLRISSFLCFVFFFFPFLFFVIFFFSFS
jgi:hypothetical protein